MIRAYYNDHDKNVCAWLEQLIKNGDITKGDVDDRSITEVTPSDIAGYGRIHLFAGVGTWDYSLNQAGWGDRPVITASLPCQPFSVAGKGLGKEDDRHLLPHAAKLIIESGIETVFGEQVASSEVVGTELEAAFIVSVQQGDFAKANKFAKRLVAQKGFSFSSRWVDDLYAEMEEAGYAVGYCILGAHSTAEEAKTGFENELFEFISRRLGDAESDLFKDWWFERGFGDGNSAEPAHIRQRLYWVAHSESERCGEAGAGSVRSEERESGSCGGMANAIGDSHRREIAGVCREAESDEAKNRADIIKSWEPGRAGRNVSVRMVNPERTGLEGHAGYENSFSEQGRDGQESVGSVAEAGRYGGVEFPKSEQMGIPGQSRQRRATGDIEWICCRDNKFRPTKRGISPLVRTIKSSSFEVANGAAGKLVHSGDTGSQIEANKTQEARAMRLKGYGNAIQAGTAEAFIKAFMSV